MKKFLTLAFWMLMYIGFLALKSAQDTMLKFANMVAASKEKEAE